VNSACVANVGAATTEVTHVVRHRRAWGAGLVVPGWTSTIVVVFFVGGVQLVMTGVMGEYIGRIYDEVKRRLLYVVRDGATRNEGVPVGALVPRPAPTAETTNV
jgi:hypothetical protein